MPLVSVLNRAFSLRPGDVTRGLPLFAYYFLIITFSMVGRVARDPIFLDHFTAVQLPFADIASAVIAGGVVALYIRTGRRMSMRSLHAASLLLAAASLLLFWWGLHVLAWPALAAPLYVFVGVTSALAVTQVWTLANLVWTTREAKRLIGLLGSSGIIGGIAGGFLAHWIAATLGTDAMLLVMAGVLLPCPILVGMIWKQTPAVPADEGAEDQASRPRSLADSAQLVIRSPHLRTIGLLICLASMVTTAAGWQLKAVAKDTLVQKDALAAYLGLFTGYTGIASLLVQLLLTTKVLRRFGVGVGLLVLPLSLVAGSLAVAVWGTLWAVTLLKGGDGVFRYSIDTSAVQLLYLPVPARVKPQVKSFIDTVIWKVGDGLAGLMLLVFATTLHFSVREISGVMMVLLAGWVAAAIVARRQYVSTLRDNIRQVRIQPDPSSVPTLDRFSAGFLAEKLTSADPDDVLYALELFEMGRELQSHAAVRRLLAHPSALVRTKALSLLSGAADESVRADVVALLRDGELDVRTEALLYLTRHDHVDPLSTIERLGDFADFSIRSATVAFLAKPGEQQNLEAAVVLLDAMVGEGGEEGQPTRLEAARLIGSLPGPFESQLAVLMDDADSDVRRQALRAAGRRRYPRLAPAIIDRLGDEPVRSDAIEALVLFEDDVVEVLQHALGGSHVPLRIRQTLPQVLLRVGSPAAARALAANLLQTDLVVRTQVISALNKLFEVRRDLAVDTSLIENAMVAELMGHYRSYQILGTLGGVADAALEASMSMEMERVFRLTKLLFPRIDLQSAYAGIRSSDPVMHANALEFLDNTLNPRLRSLLVPLIDSEVGVAERIRLADRFLGFSVPF